MSDLLVRASSDGFGLSAFGEKWFSLPAVIAVHADGQKDADERFVPMKAYECRTEGEKTIHVWHTQSALWPRKDYCLEVQEDSARFYVAVTGEHKVDSLDFFCGSAAYEASGYLIPAANHMDYAANTHMITEAGTIELGYFTPPCYVYPFSMAGCEGWMGIGIAAREGEYNFHQFHYCPSGGKCGFSLPLYGKTAVSGRWESQSLLFLPGRDAYDVVNRYAQWHYRNGYCRYPDRSHTPSWWAEPIFCGWGEQRNIARRSGGSIYDHATQADYEAMSEELDKRNLNPGILIIDDKWQKEYGSALPDPRKWPDLRRFTDAQHRKGRHVLLWFRSWYPEGLRQEECIEYLCTACGADPTSEAYRKRIRAIFHTLLSSEEGCCDCDGFKVDFANCLPLGNFVSTHGNVYGVELLKRWFTLLYAAAKEAKADALINCSCAHPYFAEVTDQARLHDYRSDLRSSVEIMGHRAKLIRAALGNVLIDTDAGGVGSHRDFLRFVQAQPTLGVPDLYYLSSAGDVPFDEEDFDRIRDVWNAYRNGLNR